MEVWRAQSCDPVITKWLLIDWQKRSLQGKLRHTDKHSVILISSGLIYCKLVLCFWMHSVMNLTVKLLAFVIQITNRKYLIVSEFILQEVYFILNLLGQSFLNSSICKLLVVFCLIVCYEHIYFMLADYRYTDIFMVLE